MGEPVINEKIILKIILQVYGVCEMDSTGWGYEPVSGFYDNGDEMWG